jgi:hypothetical protein
VTYMVCNQKVPGTCALFKRYLAQILHTLNVPGTHTTLSEGPWYTFFALISSLTQMSIRRQAILWRFERFFILPRRLFDCTLTQTATVSLTFPYSSATCLLTAIYNLDTQESLFQRLDTEFHLSSTQNPIQPRSKYSGLHT